MPELQLNKHSKFDILITVKTLCRKAKTTTWAQLVQKGFAVGEHRWGEEHSEVTTSAVGHVRMGLLASYLTDRNHTMNQVIAKAILPEMENMANGMGQIVLVGYEEGSEEPKPLLTVLFTFSQKPGELVKVSKGVQDYFQREEEFAKIEYNFPELVRHAYFGLDSFKAEFGGGVPYVVFGDDPKVPEHLRGRKFSPDLTRSIRESNHQRCVVVNIREHTTEPEGILPPHLARASVNESGEPVLRITYKGNPLVTKEEQELIEEVITALERIVHPGLSPRVAPHGISER